MLENFIKKAGVGLSHTWVPVIKIAAGAELGLPVTLLQGKKDGPTFYIGAAIHGNELTGIGTMFKIVDTIKPSDLRGKLLLVTVQNPVCFQHRVRLVPAHVYDTYGVDVHMSFPGSATGEVPERIANAILETIMCANYALDFHTSAVGFDFVSHSFSPPTGEGEHTVKAMKLTEVFGTPIAVEMKSGGYVEPNMLHTVATARGVPTFGAELGSGGSIRADAVEIGYRGVINVMRYLGMLEGDISKNTAQVIADDMVPARSDTGGIVKHSVDVGARVKKGDELAKVYDLHFKEVETIRSPATGIVYRQRSYLTINSGERVAGIATPKK